MNITKLGCTAILLAAGLTVGVLWSPFAGSAQVPRSSPSDPDARPATDEDVAQAKALFGPETAEFVRQFKDMTIHIRQFPIDVLAAPDGRFVIRHFATGEIIASELHAPDEGGAIKELVRHYDLSCGGRTFSCDFGHTKDGSKMTNVLFSAEDANGDRLSYIDSDADGRWDSFSDHTQDPPRLYERDGLSWRERKR
ncbi:MAG: hypothetical protein HY000_07935 [Planctomycetes bacterium]|nr:hypothetical protein [Planctomycetota bacterium]